MAGMPEEQCLVNAKGNKKDEMPDQAGKRD